MRASPHSMPSPGVILRSNQVLCLTSLQIFLQVFFPPGSNAAELSEALVSLCCIFPARPRLVQQHHTQEQSRELEPTAGLCPTQSGGSSAATLSWCPIAHESVVHPAVSTQTLEHNPLLKQISSLINGGEKKVQFSLRSEPVALLFFFPLFFSL